MIGLVVLDVNGTLFPLDPVADRLAEIGLGGQLEVWFARVLRDGFAASAAGTFAAFPHLARHHLKALLEEHVGAASDDGPDHVIEGFTRVTAHPDVEPALRRLREAGVTVTTMTNGTVAITRDFLHREGLDGLVDATYDVEMVQRWKPAPEPYRHVLAQHDVGPQQAALVAAHPWDVQGAIHAGLAGAWVNRSGARYPDALAGPTVEGGSLTETVEKLLQADR